MHNRMALIFTILLSLFMQKSFAKPDPIQMSVWANEAIVATYTYDHTNFLARQKEIAKYFTTDGWIAFSKALQDSKLPELIAKNAYTVSAVATLPPEITSLDDTHWKIVMPVLVVYKNAAYQQNQELKVTLTVMEAEAKQGVRGFVIGSFNAISNKPACSCQL